MADNKNDEVVLNTIKQIIKEVKQEMHQKKILTENKTPEKVFADRQKDLKKYILENVLKTLKDAEN